MLYKLEATVVRTVTDDISIHVEAASEGEAKETAFKVLMRFPDDHKEDGVNYCYLNSRTPGGIDMISLDLEEEKGVA